MTPSDASEPSLNYIPEQWYAILESKSLTEEPVGVRRLGERLVLWRDGEGRALCMPDRCSHRGAALSQGDVVDGQLECPYHGFLFNGEGRCTLIPANGKGTAVPRGFDLDRLILREEHGLLWLWWGASRPAEELPPLPWFAELPDSLEHTSTETAVWQASFGRFMESILDLHHIPFAHRKFGGGKLGPRLDPFEAEMEGDVIHLHGHLRPDDGRSVEESPGQRMEIRVAFPGTMYMELTPKLQMVVLAAPVDEESTWIAFRYYQRYVRLPGLGYLAAKLTSWSELRYLWQADRQILEATLPRQTGPGANRLISADRAIALWLKRREEVFDAAAR